MRKEKWLCLDCGYKDFEPAPGGVEIDRADGSVIAEYPKTCPLCHSNEITFGYWECDYCGDPHEHFHEMETDNICHACYLAAKSELLDLMLNNEPMSEDAKDIIKEIWEEL